MRSARDLAAGRVSAGGIAFEERLTPGLPGVTGDPMLLEQVFVNLIGNAVDAMPGGGRLTLISGAEGASDNGHGDGRVFAEVRDTGPGIVPEEVPRIFRIFYTTKAQGTGLGLALAKKFTEAHGGSISVDSQPGDGAAFRVTLPVRKGD